MCGRYSLTSPFEAVAQVFHLSIAMPQWWGSRYNIAPTQLVPVVRAGRDEPEVRRLDELSWGLVPFWAQDPSVGSRMINARSETLTSKPAFKRAFEKRRCLVVSDGFYEWRKNKDGTKQPFRICHVDRTPIAFAGLWEWWKEKGAPEDEQPLRSCTIITTDANPVVRPLHDRMPVILPMEHHASWLDPANDDTDALSKLLVPFDPDQTMAYPVTRAVGNPRFEQAACVEPIDDPGIEGDQPGLFG